MLLAPELHQMHELGTKCPSFGFRFPAVKWNAWAYLARPVIPSQTPPPFSHLNKALIQRPQRAEGDGRRRTNILTLSPELHHLILSHLLAENDKPAALSLALTSTYFFTLLHSSVHTFYLSHISPWLNTRLVILNRSVWTIPPRLRENGLSDSVTKESRFQKECDEREEKGLPFPKMGSGRRFLYACEDFGQVENVEKVQKEWMESFDRVVSGSGIRTEYKEGLRKALEYGYLFPQEDKSWLLRNLTMREFVRSETLDATWPNQRRKHARDWSVEGITFSDLVITRTYWCGTMDEESTQVKGVWAGHRFDIVVQEVHDEEVEMEKGKGKEWMDISKEVVGEAEAEWRRSNPWAYGLKVKQ